ncbi:hypothetical protein LguiA_027956 [Lonicera macranthoides]
MARKEVRGSVAARKKGRGTELQMIHGLVAHELSNHDFGRRINNLECFLEIAQHELLHPIVPTSQEELYPFGLQDLSDNDLLGMLKEGDFDGDGALNQIEFCVLMFRLKP